MNVAELIAKLQTFDPSLQVVVTHYEGGVSALFHLEEIGVKPRDDMRSGDASIFGELDEEPLGAPGTTPAIHISRWKGGWV